MNEKCEQFNLGHAWVIGGSIWDYEKEEYLPTYIYCPACDARRPITVLPEQLKI